MNLENNVFKRKLWDKITKEAKDAVIGWYKNGHTYDEICKYSGISETSIWKILKKNKCNRVLPTESIIGKKFNKLLILKFVGHKHNKRVYECLCDCGKTKVVIGPDVVSGSTRSCGCIVGKHGITHGLSTLPNGKQNPIMRMFIAAKQRSKNNGAIFDMEITDLPKIPEYCPVFPWIKIKSSGSGGPLADSPSLDRIFPEKGYVRGNIQIISHRANTIKSSGNIKEHLAVVDYLLRNGAQRV